MIRRRYSSSRWSPLRRAFRKNRKSGSPTTREKSYVPSRKTAFVKRCPCFVSFGVWAIGLASSLNVSAALYSPPTKGCEHLAVSLVVFTASSGESTGSSRRIRTIWDRS